MNAIRSLVAEHQSCTTDSGCKAVIVSCLPSANCTGNVYVNRDLDQRALVELTRELNTCVNGQPDGGSPACDRFDPPPGKPCLTVLEICDGNGQCSGEAPCRKPTHPCEGKACGDPCSNCVAGEPCLAILEFCDANGTCGGTSPACR
jgi:hypothetical protein